MLVKFWHDPPSFKVNAWSLTMKGNSCPFCPPQMKAEGGSFLGEQGAGMPSCSPENCAPIKLLVRYFLMGAQFSDEGAKT